MERKPVREYVNLKSVNSVSTGKPSFGLRVFVTLLFNNIYPLLLPVVRHTKSISKSLAHFIYLLTRAV